MCCTINKTTEANWSNKVQQNDSHSEKKGNSKIKLKKLLNVSKISQKSLPGAKTKHSVRLYFIYSLHTSDSIPIGVHIN